MMKQKKTSYSKMTLTKFIRALFSKETPLYIKAIIGVAIGYTVFPIDSLPDFFGIVGLADDAAVIGVLTTVAMTLLDNHNKNTRPEPVTVNKYEESDRDFEEVE